MTTKNALRLGWYLVLAMTWPHSVVQAQQSGPATQADSGSIVSENRRVSISVHWGDITVVGHDDPDVRFEARRDGAPDREGLRSVGEEQGADPVVLVDETRDEIRLRTPEPDSGTFSSVDLVVYVPRSVRLHVEMQRGGEIRLDGVDGELEITSRNGSVALRDISGSASVDAANGSIEAEFARVEPDVPMSFVSMNGSVWLTLPQATAADLRVRTTGDEIRTDFDMVPIPRGERPAGETRAPGRSRTLDARINGGGPLLLVTTFNGEVVLRGASQ